MGKIRQLDTQTANMIAAGEVVERPRGVVKELVENSIDAGATRITVLIEQGGIDRITVEDNGSGMDSDDASNAFLRHATSKIRSQNDLWMIHTLGFRGEALPSIASVSRLTLISSDGTDATRVVVEYGEMKEKEPYPCDQGTSITVEGLFYQTPARLKHLRSGSYEASLIQDVMGKFALSHPEIAFTLISDGRDAFRTSGQNDLLEVLYAVFGYQAAENAIPVQFEDFDYSVSGYIVKPTVTRANRNGIDLFLNGRMVRTGRLYNAVQEAYEDFIVKGRYPLVVLNITMDPHLLDVNVHPSKWEVRLSKERQLEYLIRDRLKDALAGSLLVPETHAREARAEYYEPMAFDTDRLIDETRRRIQQEAPKPQVTQVQEEQAVYHAPVMSVEEEVRQDTQILEQIRETIEAPKPKEQPQRAFPDMQVIGQLHEKFILCAVTDGLAVIDQHAAQERVHFEEYCAILNQNPIMTDTLVPLVLHAGNDIVRRVDELNAAVQDLHVTFEPFGPDTLAVRSVPSWLKELEEEPFLQDVIDNFRNESASVYTRMERKKIATMACHHSIRFNRSLTMEEMREVVRQLALCDNPYHCPHGRPTFVILKEKELVKEFLR
ncbi:MAG: DNA mismatch repair endonuclease MutL [Solobacterium sp.]|nr:DNA mismatch repair endonuclease MutL [Solobacterium sp.]